MSLEPGKELVRGVGRPRKRKPKKLKIEGFARYRLRRVQIMAERAREVHSEPVELTVEERARSLILPDEKKDSAEDRLMRILRHQQGVDGV